MNRKSQFVTGEMYHIYNRGVEKRPIFLDQKDYERFIRSLFIFNSSKDIVYKLTENKDFDEIDRGETIVDIGVYTLMTNHFHFILREKQENGISRFMQKLLTSYTMYFNKKYNRTGALFGSTFHSKHIDTDEYLKILYAYINLNIASPYLKLKIKGDKKSLNLKKILNDYKYSSYLDYCSKVDRKESLILTKSVIQDNIDFEEDLDLLIEDWWEYKLMFEDFEPDSPLLQGLTLE